ncbi:4-hydroxy-tetrahydrodipicolinate synthase [Gammaproteobacteria bacterium]|nr:4-hydroxy-tetrahydrodipicolinate synthase [Gammaproteobacteria bacterium]
MYKLKGSIVALVTPMESDGSIAWQSLFDLIDWHVESGTSGLVLVGTTGESATIDVAEHVQIIEQSSRHAKDRIPIIAGTGANSTKEAIYLTSAAKKVGADAVLLVTPYYNKPTQSGLIAHYLEIANEVEIPQILYNVPSRTGCDLLPETVFKLSTHKNIIGLKEATGDLGRLDILKEGLNEQIADESFLLYSGDDPTSTEFILNGGSGTISVTANVVPGLISEICTLALLGDREKAILLNSRLEKLNALLFIESNPIPVKWILNRLGRVPEGLRLPLTTLNEKYYDQMELLLSELSLLN